MKERHSKSTKMTFNTRTIAGKLGYFLIIIGAVVATIAPFLHIFFDRESTTNVFGYRNARIFFYSAGVPFTLFITCLILNFVANFIDNKFLYRTVRNISFIILSVSVYYLIWVFWAKKDLNAIFYYSMIVILSITSSFAINKLLYFFSKSSKSFVKISKKIPDLDKNVETINDIAKIMPSENEDIVTYKTLVDITGDNLLQTVTDIKKDLD